MNTVNLVRMCAGGVAAGLVILSTGCTQTTGGAVVKAPEPIVPPLPEAALDRVLLSVHDVESIVGLNGLEMTLSSEKFGTMTDDLSDPACIASMYLADEAVYGDTDWTAVRDQIIRKDDAQDHSVKFVEQVVVLFSSEEETAQAFDDVKDKLQECANLDVATGADDDELTTWLVGDLQQADDRIITQVIEQQASSDWTCQHALGVVSNVLVEGFACGNEVSDEGEQVVYKLLENAATTG